MRPLIKHPAAWLPLAMSLTALATVLGSVATYGVVHEADEGASTAHIFQLLIALQTPLVLFIALKWLPKTPRPAFSVLAYASLRRARRP